MKIPVILLAFLLCGAAKANSDFEHVRSTVESWNRGSRFCPPEPSYKYTRVHDNCQRIYTVCLKRGNDNDTYNRCTSSYNACSKEAANTNELIDRYNEIISQCKSHQVSGDQFSSIFTQSERDQPAVKSSISAARAACGSAIRSFCAGSSNVVQCLRAHDSGVPIECNVKLYVLGAVLKTAQQFRSTSIPVAQGSIPVRDERTGNSNFEACVARWIAAQPICHDGWHDEECKTMAIEPCGGRN
jgi:hypothetical protein